MKANTSILKYIVLVIISLSLTNLSLAQTETLFGGLSKKGWGGFGGPIMEISNFIGNTSATVGGGGGAIVGEFFFGGFGQATGGSDMIFNNELYSVSMGVGGIWLGYTPQSHKLIHPYGGLKIGWGGINMDLDGWFNDRGSYLDSIFLIQPEIGLEINITKWFRLAMTGGYRYITGVNDLPGGLDNNDFSSFSGNLSFRFGSFPN